MARRSVFISYARLDRDEVLGAVDLLRAGGVTVFLDVVDIDFGERWKEALAKALAGCERVMVFWSRAAAASEWVEREWRYALALGKKIVPTLLDVTPLPPELAEFQAVKPVRAAPPDASHQARSPRKAAAVVAGAVLLGAFGAGSFFWLSKEPSVGGNAPPPSVSVPAKPSPTPPPAATGRPPIAAEPSRPHPPPPAKPTSPVQSDIAEQMLSPQGWGVAALLLLLALAAWWARRRRPPAEAADFVERVFSA